MEKRAKDLRCLGWLGFFLDDLDHLRDIRGLVILRCQQEELLEGAKRLFHPVLIEEDQADPIVGFRIVFVARDGFLEGRQGCNLIGFPLGCQRTLLKNSSKPFVLVDKEMPQADILEFMKKKEAVLALVLDEKNAAEYYHKLDRAMHALGSKRLMIMNGNPIQEAKSIALLRHLTREILQAGTEWDDIQNLFSATFLGLFE